MKRHPLLITLIMALACSTGLAKKPKNQAPTHANVAYDKHDRTVLDFWQAKGEGPRPLLVYIHGGGWIKGDKRDMRNSKVYLDQGISVASVNYRLLGEGFTLPSPVHDAARAVQFLRSKAREWNIDNNKIVLSGRSAGACSSLWIACHDDLAKPDSNDPVARESTRVLGAGVEVGQTSIDPVVIEPWIGPKVYHPMIYKAVGEDSAEAMHKNYAKHKGLYREFSAINHLSEDDPLLFLKYDSRFDMSVPAKSINHGIHHPVFGVKFKEQSAKVGHQKVELMVVNHEKSDRFSSIEDFVIKTLVGGASAPAAEVQSVVYAQPSTVIPAPSKLKKFMPRRHDEKLKEAKERQIDLVMIGDSITHNWERMDNYESTFEGRNLLNLGFAGDRTQNVLWRLQHGALDGIAPKLVTLMIGTNHMHLPKKGYAPDTPEDIFTGIQAVVAEIRTRLPDAKLIVFSVFPRGPEAAQQRVNAVNAMLPQLADQKHIFHVNINHAFLGEDGALNKTLYKGDQLHLSLQGYGAWAGVLVPLLEKEGPNTPRPRLAGSRPNIILVMTDDQGMGDLSCMGNTILRTPHIDALYEKATRFADFHVSPTCAPTRAAVMSGRFPFEVGVSHTLMQRERLAPNVVTFPQALQKAGYKTGLFGKWHLGDGAEYLPQNRGFDEVLMHGAGGIGQHSFGDFEANATNKYFDNVFLHNDTVVKTKGFCTDVFFQAALSWMKKQYDTDAPFFAYISLNAPHGPLIAPEKYKKRFLEEGYNQPTAARYGMIENIDDNMGVLMQKLTDWQVLQKTLVIFMTDNGMAMKSIGKKGHKGKLMAHNAGLRGHKDTNWEGGTHVPSFWYWQGVLREGIDVPALTAHIDLYRTFCAIAGADVPVSNLPPAGRSLLPLLEDPNADWPDRSLFAHRGRWGGGGRGKKTRELAKFYGASVRTARWRLVYEMDGKGPWLSDISQDPGEQKNVITEYPEVAQKLKADFDSWWDSTEALLVNEGLPRLRPGEHPLHQRYAKQLKETGIPAWEPARVE